MKTEKLLTPEFIEFSNKIAEIFKLKEVKTNEFKELYLKHKTEIAELESQAKSLQEAFDAI